MDNEQNQSDTQRIDGQQVEDRGALLRTTRNNGRTGGYVKGQLYLCDSMFFTTKTDIKNITD